MPLINGLKMACEPCIRGHRSTKCNHANERLMVQVRKPGRPLSQCPHPGGQACMCGSVTAAIPRKQTCHCGNESQPATAAPLVNTNIPSGDTDSMLSDLPSPTKAPFKVQKSVRPQSQGRKQSFDPSNFARMDMNSVNILPFKSQTDIQPIQTNIVIPQGYTMVSQPPIYAYSTQYAGAPSQFPPIAMQLPQMPYDGSSPIVGMNGFSNGHVFQKDPYAVESPLSTPTIYANGGNNSHLIGKINGMNGVSNGGSCCAPSQSNGTNGTNGNHTIEASVPAKKSSCCAPKAQSAPSVTTSPIILPETNSKKTGGCCSSKAAQPLKQESNGTPMMSSAPNPQHTIAHANMPFVQAYYPQYIAHDSTMFTYPSTYGSFQNPLQPAAWKESMRTNNYNSQPAQPMAEATAYQSSVPQSSMNTIHECSCGDSCQCVGCAAHPYNEPTQDYVRSAWQMSMNQSSGDVYTNGHQPTTPLTNGNGHGMNQSQNGDLVASPTANSDTTSGTGDEQNLPAENYLFVNYPFTDNCAGDMTTCPCGDDCECIGCEIHRRPLGNCCGTEETCQCGDDCECLGCTIHNPRIPS
ncbi:Zinc copper-regulated transcription factor [Glarea lozoyensis ATCC 20868]|uniref:Zinc copper-regulated transcription factor n=1 Tax=Glarea lozoyensis (strain ATCC 20868 / MF5171) TaxID=1116229 RepID=S3D610_GLAL2|nr:Zinc copper-regulated transcription factor [Glarea lozoyensis ATCC 20868]EPE32569.1 Zinc copper-regulated transcription factor [Glarea lozoyensis ATCC 20868]